MRFVLVGVLVAWGLGLLALPALARDASRGQPPISGPRATPCVHPWPCADDWPDGLHGPFELSSVEYTSIQQGNGVELEAWIGRPELPEGVRAPVILVASPYYGNCSAVGITCFGAPSEAGWWEDPPLSGPLGFPESTHFTGMTPRRLVTEGFAVAFVSLPGTGNSGGCLDDGGPSQIDAMRDMIDWLANQQWSNGRVGVAGLSYMAQAAAAGLVSGTDALKTAVVAGTVFDMYLTNVSPQGAAPIPFDTTWGVTLAELSIHPNPFMPDRAPGHVRALTERPCPAFLETVTRTATVGWVSDRDEDYWREHMRLPQLEDVTASVLLLHGFQEIGTAHIYQDDEAFRALASAPKRQVEGQWGHEWPTEADRTQGGYEGSPKPPIDPPHWWTNDFDSLYIDWMDYWLKGEGSVPEGLGTVEYQDSSGTWRRSGDWPPVEARPEALFVAGDLLAAEGTDESRSFESAAYPLDLARSDELDVERLQFYVTPNGGPRAGLCPGTPLPGAPSSGVGWFTEPVVERVTIAGNPYALLNIESTQPGGILVVHLYDVAPDFSCDARGYPTGATEIYGESSKGADLQFLHENYVAEPFRVGELTPVRIDLPSIATVLEPGHRLAMTVSVGRGPTYFQSGGFAQPTITVVGGTHVDASRLVLPIVAGSLGGPPERGTPPPRPFSVGIPESEPITGPPPPRRPGSHRQAVTAAVEADVADGQLPATGGGLAALALPVAVLLIMRRGPAA